MVRYVLLVSALLISMAYAQQPPPFVPITIDETGFKALREYLDQVPFKHSLPLVKWLEEAEMKAQAEASKKSTPPPPVNDDGK